MTGATLASVEVSLTILKTKNTQIDTHTHAQGFRPRLKMVGRAPFTNGIIAYHRGIFLPKESPVLDSALTLKKQHKSQVP